MYQHPITSRASSPDSGLSTDALTTPVVVSEALSSVSRRRRGGIGRRTGPLIRRQHVRTLRPRIKGVLTGHVGSTPTACTQAIRLCSCLFLLVLSLVPQTVRGNR